MAQLVLVFVHGYSVSHLDTYGGLPARLRNEALSRGLNIKVEDIYLGRYISFNDEVRLDDVAKALETAVRQQVLIKNPGTQFICITHSTGGPVVRTWWHHYYKDKENGCPMSHLIMLSPANHGSALAQLGKTRLSRVKSWFDGVEPGQKILDWLELGSKEAWDLNLAWIKNEGRLISLNGIFLFVITGQDVDRKLYDHINSYTGEAGSDGVVRVASANLNSRYIKLAQPVPQVAKGQLITADLEVTEFYEAPPTPLLLLPMRSHSGEDMGIMKSVSPKAGDEKSGDLINAIFDCIGTVTPEDYQLIFAKFAEQSATVQKEGLVETEHRLSGKKYYLHDRHCMIIFRLSDMDGQAITNFDLLLTTGEDNDPDALPEGFFADRQCNKINHNSLTYFINYDLMTGSEAITDPDGELIRKAISGIDKLGLVIKPRPDEGFIRYLPCKIDADSELFKKVLNPNSTTLIDICLRRIVSTEVFRFEKAKADDAPGNSFKGLLPGSEILA